MTLTTKNVSLGEFLNLRKGNENDEKARALCTLKFKQEAVKHAIDKGHAVLDVVSCASSNCGCRTTTQRPLFWLSVLLLALCLGTEVG
jgi:hypothetical protein